MATVGFQLARPAANAGGGFPLTIELAILTGYAENEGALLTTDVNNNFVACGADPAQVAAIALTPGGADTSGFNILGRKEYPPNTMQGIAVNDSVRFLAPFLGALPAVPGGAFGVTRDVDGTWKVDFNKPDKPTVTYLGNPVKSFETAGTGQNSLVEVVFLPGIVQPI